MRTKYIFVSGGVISGLGKGVTTASIALLLKSAGFKVTLIKYENYLNLDAGMINPIEHGDTFLCEDGTETDMDIGTYEKFLNQDMGRKNFVTMGQIYKAVIDREREFGYNGEDVEAIPHITDEILLHLKEVVKKDKAEIVIAELGGTAGEYQNALYYEASRILHLKNPGDVIHVHVGYMPTPGHLGEPKTKPIQLSVRTLNSMGIQPDFIVARSDRYLDERRRERFALFCNVAQGNVISSPDVKSVYEIPIQFFNQQFHAKISKSLNLPLRRPNLAEWKKLVHRIASEKKTSVRIAIVGKYFGTGSYHLRDSYAALFDALDHAAWANNVSLETRWVDAERVEKEGIEKLVGKPDGLIVPIGWGKRGSEGMIQAASYARRAKIPYLGLCYGMQLAVVAFARDILKWREANSEENDSQAKYPIIHFIPRQKELVKNKQYGASMRLGGWEAMVKPGTEAFSIYKKHDGFINERKGLTSERHRHRYEFNDKYAAQLEKAGLVIAARSVKERLVEIVELPKSAHPFYLGTQGHPEYKSRPLKPHPIFSAFIEAAKKEKKG